MSESGQTTSSALQELLRDGKLAGSWALDAARSEIGLKSKSMWGLVPVKGVFREVTGTGTVSAAGDVTGTVTVAAKSIDTKNKKRDEHLRSADFFDVANYPGHHLRRGAGHAVRRGRHRDRRPHRPRTAPVRCPSPRGSPATRRRCSWTARSRSTGQTSA